MLSSSRGIYFTFFIFFSFCIPEICAYLLLLWTFFYKEWSGGMLILIGCKLLARHRKIPIYFFCWLICTHFSLLQYYFFESWIYKSWRNCFGYFLYFYFIFLCLITKWLVVFFTEDFLLMRNFLLRTKVLISSTIMFKVITDFWNLNSTGLILNFKSTLQI